MKRFKTHFWPVIAGLAIAVLAGGGPAFAAHPDIPLYTYEEVAAQYNSAMMPVMIDPATMKGMPYSPKQTCGNCHNGTTASWDQQHSFSEPLTSYEQMSQHAFHAELGAEEWQHSSTETTQPGKPWSRSNGMFGKW